MMKSLGSDTLEALAELICGDRIGPVRRTGSELGRFFRAAGLACEDLDNETRKWWALDRLNEYNADPAQISRVIKRLADPREYPGSGERLRDALGRLNSILAPEGLKVVHKGAVPEIVEVTPTLPDDFYMAVENPDAIRTSLAEFSRVYPDPRKVAFIMMEFSNTPAHKNIVATIKEAMGAHGIAAVRADERRFNDSLFPNVQTYMHGCGLGIAVFERITSDRFNPNVALEVGYILALRKPVCLLKDSTLQSLHSDLLDRIYEPFDFQNPAGTIPPKLEAWLRDKDLIPRPADAW